MNIKLTADQKKSLGGLITCAIVYLAARFFGLDIPFVVALSGSFAVYFFVLLVMSFM